MIHIREALLIALLTMARGSPDAVSRRRLLALADSTNETPRGFGDLSRGVDPSEKRLTR